MSRLLGSVRRPWMVALFAILAATFALLSQSPAPSQAAQAPTNLLAPVINANDSYFGYAQNKQLTVTPGSWTDSPTSVSYQWYRCSSAQTASATDPTNCQIITGDTGLTHLTTAGDVGFYLTVKETATNGMGSSYYFASVSNAISQSNVVAVGNQSTCVIRLGKVYCTGNNGSSTSGSIIYGFYGNGTTGTSGGSWVGPAATATGTVISDAISISSSFGNTCVLTYSGSIYCVGVNTYSQLGIGTSGGQAFYFAPMMQSQGVPVTGASAIAVGDGTTCFIKSGSVYCVGVGSYGSIGDGTTTGYAYPVKVKLDATHFLTGAIQIAGGASNTYVGYGSSFCAITNDGGSTTVGGTLYCWGANENYQLGDMTAIQKNYATLITVGSGTSGVTNVSISSGHACAIKNTGVYCWGYNINGQTGIGVTNNPQTSPVAAVANAGQSFSSGFAAVATDVQAGGSSCFIRNDGSNFCTGLNTYQNLNQGNTTQALLAKVANDWTAGTSEIHLSSVFSCGFNSILNKLLCTGMNGYGAFGVPGGVGHMANTATEATAITGTIGVPNKAGVATSTQISGNSNIGDTLTDASVWTGFPAPALSYQWYSCSAPVTATASIPGTCTSISGATTSTYTVQAGDLGSYITPLVSATNAAGITTSMLTQPNPVGQLPSSSVAALTVPTSSTGPITGMTLTTTTVTWAGASPSGTAATQWFRCNSSGSAVTSTSILAGCSAITGATNNAYKLTKSENGFFVRASQTYISSSGTVYSFSATSAQVRPSTAVGGDDSTSCAMRYGKVYCWGPMATDQDAAYSGTVSYASLDYIPTAITKADGTPLTEVVQFDAGRTGSCAVRIDKSLWCWGQNWGNLGLGATANPTPHFRATKVSTNDGNWVQVSVAGASSASATCAIDTSGAIWCSSSYSNFGFTGDNASPSTTFTRSTTLTSGFIQIAGSVNGGQNFCALKNTGALYCWGLNTYGNVGTGNSTAVTTAMIPIGLESGVTNVAMNGGTTCAIKNGTPWCWGVDGAVGLSNSFGIPGTLNGTGYLFSPVSLGAVVTQANWTSVMIDRGAAGYQDRICLISISQSVSCAGANGSGQLNTGTTSNLGTFTATRWTSGVTDIVSNAQGSNNVSCAAVNNALYCIGSNIMGQLGNGTYGNNPGVASAPPVNPYLSNGVGLVDVAPINMTVSTSQNYASGETVTTTLSGDATPVPTATYQWYSCTQSGVSATSLPADCSAISEATSSTYTVSTGDVGSYIRVQVTVSNVVGSSNPVSSASLVGALPSAMAPSTTISVPSVKLFTGNTITAPAMPTFTGTPTPTVASQWYRCTSTSASWTTTLPATCYPVEAGTGATYTLTHSDDGFFMMFGQTATSSAGTSGLFSPTTIQVIYANKIAMSGDGGACVIKNGRVYCWGYQLAGGVLGQAQVLNGAMMNSVTSAGVVRTFPSTSVRLASGAPLGDVVSIAMGKDHACAVTYSGSLYCWGTNTNGVLGDGTTTSRYTAAPVLTSSGNPLTNVTRVAAGSVNTCAISNSSLICWGAATSSSGILASALSYASTTVTNLTTGVQQVVVSEQNACAIQVAAAKCWGMASNNANASGTTTPNTSSPPVAAPSSYINGKLVSLSGGVSNLSSGLNQGCAIKLGATYCWGGATSPYNLGIQSYSWSGAFTAIPAATDGTTFDSGSVQLASGTQSAALQAVSCVVKTSGAVYCAGNGNYGAGASGTFSLPNPATNLTSGVTEMAVGGFETCAIKNSAVWCGGNDGAGTSGAVGYQSNLLQDSSAASATVQPNHVLVSTVPTPLGFSESAPATGTVSITGYTVIGNTLTAVTSNFENSGAWQGVPTPAMTQQWYLCTSPGEAASTLPSDCTALSGVTESTTTVTSGQTGSYFRVQATATNSFGSATLYSAALGPVGDAPTLTTASTMNSPNSPVLNSTTSISGNAGTFGGTTNTITTTYQWYRCLYSSASASTSVPSDCMATPNGANTTYSLTSSDVGVYLRFATIGTASTGKVISISASSSQVMEGAKVAMNTNSTCAVKLGRVYCWGSNTDYGFGNGTAQATTVQTADVATAVKTSSTTVLENVVDLRGGKTSYCAIDTSGALYCWGSNTTGQTGNNTPVTVPTQYASTPSAATDNAVFTSGVVGVSVGPAGTCAWKTSGLVYCWGQNDAGILGSSSFTMTNQTKALTPQLIPSLTNVSTMDVGQNAACAVSLGAVYCWGNNNAYLTVDGTNSSGTQWTPIARSTVTSNVTTVSVGTYTPCAIMNYGVYCWSSSATGALGVGNAYPSGDYWKTGAIAQSGPTSTGVTDIFMNKAYFSGCALKAGSGLYCWGADAEGSQPGLTIPSNNSYNPAPVLSTITGVSYLTSGTGVPNAYCLIANNALSCNGRAANYILGNSTTTPNLVGTASSVPNPYSPASFSSNLGADYVAPTFTSSATVSGSTLLTGQSLTTTVPAAIGFPTPIVTLNWFDCTGVGPTTTTTPIDCSSISNSSSATYTLQNEDINFHIRSGFTAVNAVGTVNTYSAATSNTVSKINYSNVVRPIGGGTVLQAGDVISQPLAVWSSSLPVTTSIAWYRCGNDAQAVSSSVPTDCSAIAGATGNTYTVKASDAGNYIRSYQTATNSSGTVTVMSKATNFVISTTLPKLAISAASTCVIKNGGVECAGYGMYGQLGNNSITTQTTPVKVLKSATASDYLTGVVAIFSGTAGNYCAITATAELWCWGSQATGNTYFSTTVTTDARFALQPLGSTKVANVGMGNNAMCAVTEGAAGAKGGALWCWGNGGTGNYYLGDGSSLAKWLGSKVLTIATGVSQVSLGSYNACAVVNEGLSCWGAYGVNAYGGAGASAAQTTPVANSTLATGVTKVAVGSSEACAIKDGGVYCWGLNSIGTLGNGTTTQSQTPVAVSAATDSTSLASGVTEIAMSRDTVNNKSTACAVKSTGALYCWGYGTNYNLLDGTSTASQKTPKPSTLTSGVTGVAIGTTDDITCAIKTSTLYCAGPARSYAQYMNGLLVAQTTPTAVATYNAPNYVAAPTAPTVSIPAISVVGTPLNPDLGAATGIETPSQTFTWYVCSSSHTGNTSLPNDCLEASGATSRTASYTPVTADKTQFLMVAVTQSNSGGAAVTGYSDTTNAVVLGLQTISITGADTVPVLGGATTQLTATSSSGLSTFAWTSNTPYVCSVNNSGVVTAVGGGRCEIVASQAGNSDYAAGSGVAYMTLARAPQTISWTAPSSLNFASVSTLAGLASSGVAITYASTTPAVCTVSGSRVTALTLGTCNLTANQAGNTGFFPATQVSASIQVVPSPQLITFTGTTTSLANGTYTLNATVDTGQTVTYSVADTSICRVSGSTLTLVAQGACEVTASQNGSSNYEAATPVTATINIVSTPTVVTRVTSDSSPTFGVPVSASPGTWMGATPLITALQWYVCTNSGGAVAGVGNFAELVPADCAAIESATEATFTPTAAVVGGRLRVAEQASNIISGTSNYYTVFAAATSAVAKKSQTITFSALADATYGDSTISLAATSDRGKTISYSSSDTSVCTISGSTLTIVAAGSCEVTASQAGDATTLAATSVAQTLTVSKQAQTITLPDFIDGVYGGANVSSGATASSGLTVTLTSNNTSVCTVTGLSVVPVNAGSCSVSATQVGNSNYLAANSVTKSFTVAKASQTISFTGSAQQLPSGNFNVAGSATSALTLSFASTTPSVCTVSGSTVTPLTLGTCTVKASQAGNSNYNAAVDVSANFTIESVPVQNSSVTISSATSYNFNAAVTTSPGSWTGTGTISLTYSWFRCDTARSITSGVGTATATKPSDCNAISGQTTSTYTPVAADIGKYVAVVETASNVTSAGANYRSTWVSTSTPIEKQFQNITFGTLANATYGDSAITLTGSSDRSLTISYVSSNTAVCTVSGSTLIVVAAGSCDVTASQAGDANTLSATSVTQTLTVNKKAQTITLPDFTAGVYGGANKASGATTTSGLTITLVSADTAICTVSGLNVSQVTPGTCSITATQSGDSNYLAATSVTKTFTIAKASQTITFAPTTKQKPAGDFAAGGSASSGLTISYSSSTTSVCTVSGSAVSPIGLGTCSITASQTGDSNYLAATSVTASFTIESVPVQTSAISVASAANYRFGAAITTTSGTWTGTSAITVSRTWYRCDTAPSISAGTGSAAALAPAGCALISGSTGSSYTPVAADLTKYVAVAETASNTTSTGSNLRTTFVSTSTAIEKQTQTITFGALSNATFGDAQILLTGSSDRSLAISYTSSNASVCSASGSILTIVSPGTCDITASQAGDVNTLEATSVTRTLTVVKANQSVSLNNLAAIDFRGTPTTLVYSATSTLPVTVTSNSTAICTVSGTTVSVVAVGTCSITASQTGDTNYNAATSVTKTFVISKAQDTLTFTGATKQFRSGNFNISASTLSGASVSFATTTPLVCAVSGTTVTPVTHGACVITATAATNSNYTAPANVNATFTIERAVEQTAVHSMTSFATYWYDQQISYTAGTWVGSGTVTVNHTWYVCNSRPTTTVVASNTVPTGCTSVNETSTGAYKPAAGDIGKFVVLAEVASNVTSGVTNTAKSWISSTGMVTKLSQTLTFAPLADKTYGSIPFVLTGTSDKGTAISYTSSDPSVCEVSVSTVSIVSAGTCDITASQPGNETIAAAISVTRTLTVNKASQAINFAALSDVTYSASTISIAPSASSALDVALVSDDTSVCSLNGTTISLIKSGTCSLTASQAGNGNYSAASNVTRTFQIAKASQTVTFSVPDFISLGSDNAVTLNGTSSVGLAVSYTVANPSICDVQNGKLIANLPGTCSVTATQAGDDRYLPTSVTRSAMAANYAVVQSIVPSGSLFTNGTSTEFTITFDEPISEFTSADLSTVPAGACSIDNPQAVNGDLAVYSVQLNNCAVGSVVLKVAANSISNGAPGPTLDYVGTQPVTIDRTFLQAITYSPQFTSPTNDAALVYNVTFAEPVTNFDASDLTITGSGSTDCAALVSGSGSSYTLTLTSCDEGSVQVGVKTNSVSDRAGNNGPSSATQSNAVVLDLTAPNAPSVSGLPVEFSRPSAFTASFETISDNTYHCSLNGTELAGCTGSLALSLAAMVAGDYTLDVWATDAAGNDSVHYSHSWTIGNFSRPATPIINVPGFERTSYNHLLIKWGAVTSQSAQLPVTGLLLEYSTNGTTWTVVPEMPPNETSYDLSMQSGSVYSFRLKALSGPFAANASDYSTVGTYTATYKPAILSMSTSAALMKPATGSAITLTGTDLRDLSVSSPNQSTGTVVTITDSAGKAFVARITVVTATSIRFVVPTTSKIGVATLKVTVGAGIYQSSSSNRNLNIVAKKVNQVVTFTPPSSVRYSDPDVQVTATLSSFTLPVFTIDPVSIGICSVSPGGLIHALKGGSCSYKISAPASDAFNAFVSPVYTTAVTRLNVSLTFELPQNLRDAFTNVNQIRIRPDTYELSATADANIPNTVVKISSSPETTCFVDADKLLHIVGVGTCTVSALAENDFYRTEVPVTKTFLVLKNDQLLTFVPPGTSFGLITAMEATDASSGFQLSAFLDSGLTPNYESVNSEICSVDATGIVIWSGDLAKFTTQKCQIRIYHDGDANFGPITPQTFEFGGRHLPPLAPVGGWIREPDGALAVGRTGGLASSGGDGVAVVVVTGNKITITPFSKGMYIGPITATVTIPYYVPVKNVMTLKTQVCTVQWGVLKKMKASDPTAFKVKKFGNVKFCAANKDAIAYFAQGNRLLPTIVVKRDRRWPTTYLSKMGSTGKGQKIYPAVKTWHLTIG